MSAPGTKRTCRGRLAMSAPEGKTDVPREPGTSVFDPFQTWAFPATFNHRPGRTTTLANDSSVRGEA